MGERRTGTPLPVVAYAISVYHIMCHKNGNAPIFECADYGIEGDLFKVVPMLIDAIKAAKAAK